MKNLDIDLVDHHEASVESSGDGYVYVTVDAEFGLIPDSPIYLEYQLLCLRDDVVVSSSDPSSAELTFENPRVYITDSFHAGEDQIPDSYKINFRVFVPDEPVVIDTPIPPEIARQSGAFLIHSPKKGLLSREKWASGGVTAESVVVKNVAGEDDELFVNLAAKNYTQSGFVLTCESADNSDYTIFKIIDKPQVTSDHLRLHLKKDLKVTLVGYLAGDWKSTEKTAITEIKQNFQGSSDSSHTLDELAAEGIRITTDEIMRWRQDLNFGMELNPSLAAELVDFDDPDEVLQTIRYLAGYAIDKYQFAHEDHERDWAGNILLLDAFKAYRKRAVSEWDGIENPSEEEADEYISVEALVNCSGFSEKDTTLLAYNYLLSMRGAELYVETNDPQLTSEDWRRELTATLEFLTSDQSDQEFAPSTLRYSDSRNGDSSEYHYRIWVEGAGFEIVCLKVSEEAYRFWESHTEEHGDSDLISYVTSSGHEDEFSFDDIETLPESAKFLREDDYDHTWTEPPNEIFHHHGANPDDSTLTVDQIEEPMADAMDIGSVLEKVSIQDHEVDYEWEDQEPNYYFIEIVHGEKGLFFNGILSLDNQFDPEKLSIECSGFSPDHTNSVVSRLVYDGEEIEGEFDSSREVYTEVRLHDW